MERNDILNLVAVVPGEQDGKGFRKEGPHRRTEVFCGVGSVGRQEFYEAARSGMEASAVFIVDAEDFEAASIEAQGRKVRPSEVEYRGEAYKVHRTFVRRCGDMELVCGRMEERPETGGR